MEEPDPYRIPSFGNSRPTYKLTDFDLGEIRALAKMGCTYEEIAKLIGLHPTTLFNMRKKFPEIQEVIDEGKATLQKSIRVAQLKAGVDDGNVPMLIHLGKHYLDQKEKMDINQHVSGEMIIDTEFRKTEEPTEEDSETS